MEKEYPFLTDYAKSDRSNCKGCKTNISKGSLRLAALVQSSHFDGKMTAWYHFNCFFDNNKKIKALEEIKNVDSLRWEDQEKIKNKLSTMKSDAITDDVFSYYGIEYSKAKAAKCSMCTAIIDKGALKMSHKVLGSNGTVLKQWHHVECFHSIKKEILQQSPDFDVTKIPGLNKLKDVDNQEIIDKFKDWKSKKRVAKTITEDTVSKKRMKEDTEVDSKLKDQNELMWKNRERLQNELSKSALVKLLEYNEQYVPPGEANILDVLSDCMTFGCINHCPECEGHLSYSNNKYKCTSNVNEWTKCLYETIEINRSEFKIPPEYVEIGAMKDYKYIPSVRVLSEESLGPVAPLSGYIFSVDRVNYSGGYSRRKIETRIKELGGSVKTGPDCNCAVVISNSLKSVNCYDINICKQYNIPVVTPVFLNNLDNADFFEELEKHNCADWNRSKEELVQLKNIKPQWIKNRSYLDEMNSQMVTVNGGKIIDPDSGLENKAHIYRDKKSNDKFNAILGMVDLIKGSNSFYKLQLLESENRKKWWVFRSWGRIGTVIGGNKKESFVDLLEAIENFEATYLDKTGNEWSNRGNFQKQSHKFYPMDVDYGDDGIKPKLSAMEAGSSLPKAVDLLIRFIFDIESMRRAMMSFKIDLKKMPLGKLSTKQIELSYKVLNELQQLLSGPATTSKSKLLDASTRFYTLLPHDFGMRAPPLIDSLDMIKSKSEMIDNLMEIEIAYKMMKVKSGENTIDKCYDQLHNRINIVEKGSETFSRIETYLHNTHANTHDTYTLDIVDIFDLARGNEDTRFDRFKQLPNRMMLWHGSRRTNWAGILSQGLRIAPPEAPMSGYMFGKGIYFADMVSKSANYCLPSNSEPEGLLLLCEVALGHMTERSRAHTDIRLEEGEDSCKGTGATIPDPDQSVIDEDGVIYPLGTPLIQPDHRGDLQYNEYIVYDVGQVRQRFLVRVRFHYNSRL